MIWTTEGGSAGRLHGSGVLSCTIDSSIASHLMGTSTAALAHRADVLRLTHHVGVVDDSVGQAKCGGDGDDAIEPAVGLG